MERSLVNSLTSSRYWPTKEVLFLSFTLFISVHVLSCSGCDFIVLNCILFKKTVFTVIFRLGMEAYTCQENTCKILHASAEQTSLLSCFLS